MKPSVKWVPEPVWPEPKYEYITDPAAEIPVVFEGDVAVIGGGISGVTAAVAAAREGASVVLIERLGQLGGCGVTNLMGSFAPQFINKKYGQVLKGIPYEVVERLTAAGGAQHDNVRDVLMGKDNIHYMIPFKPEILGQVFTEMALEAGVKIMLHTHFSHVLGPKNRPTGAVVVNKSGSHGEELRRCQRGCRPHPLGRSAGEEAEQPLGPPLPHGERGFRQADRIHRGTQALGAEA